MNRPSHKRRRGFTLRELTVAFTLGSSVMMVSVGTLHKVFDWSTTARHRRQDDQSFFRLQQAFRNDVREASGGKVSEDGKVLTLSLPAMSTSSASNSASSSAGAATYTVHDDAIDLQRTGPNGIVRHEYFRWKVPRNVEFSSADAGDLISLRARTRGNSESETLPVWRTAQAVLGLRLKFIAAQDDSAPDDSAPDDSEQSPTKEDA